MKLKKIMETIVAEDYPQSWNPTEFKKLKNFAERKRYCDQHLTFLISGSGRLVYKIDDEKVLKLAKNQKGVAQCDVEINLGNDSYLDGIVAPIYDYDENGLWVEMALATKLTKSKFKSLVGYDFDEFATQIFYFYHTTLKPSRYMKPTPSELQDEIVEDEFYSAVCDLMGSFDMPVGDLKRLNSYGIVKENGKERVALIDYGLTNSVYDSYYK